MTYVNTSRHVEESLFLILVLMSSFWSFRFGGFASFGRLVLIVSLVLMSSFLVVSARFVSVISFCFEF